MNIWWVQVNDLSKINSLEIATTDNWILQFDE